MQRRDGKLIVSATDLVGFLECGHLSALDMAVANGTLAKPHFKDATLDLIRDRGGRHEQRYIASLRDANRAITDLSGNRDLPYAEQAERTAEAMRRGDDVIYQATVFDGRWVGHPDFLLRVPAAGVGVDAVESPLSVSRLRRSEGQEGGPGIDRTDSEVGGDVRGLGHDWHYEVADTKLAHSAKASALIQICSYVDQIERIQGITPERVYVVTGGAEIKSHQFRTAEMMAYYRHAKQRFEQALEAGLDHTKSYPDPVEHCGVCRWQVACNRLWHADDALPIVTGITRSQRTELKAVAVTTRGGLATAAGLDKKFERVANQARVQVESDNRKPPVHELLKPEEDSSGAWVADRGLSALPTPSVGDLFFDIEGDPFALWEGLEYLFGLWDGKTYEGYWSLDREQEQQQFEHVIDLFTARRKADPGMHVYHFGSYEPSHLKRLAGRHATKEEELDELLRGRVFVDLYRVVRQGLRAGVESYSIKKLEALYGYERTIDLREATDSIVEFELWLDGWLENGVDDKKLLADIEAYNRDDCVSTLALRDWLESLRADAARQFGGELPRPPTETRPTSEELTARQAAVHALEERLTAPITTVVADQTDGDKQTWLLAHLLDWHRRENKASWWRFYDLLGKSDEELLGEAEPIAGLVFDKKWSLPRPGRSDIYRYRFPAQEYKVKLDVGLWDPATGERTGTAEAIDKDANTIDIKRSRDWAGSHPTAVVPRDIYSAPEQAAALMQVGEWVAANGIESGAPGWRAARDLLMRRAPRAIGQVGGETLVREREPGSEAARRLVVQLNGTTLAIQGPPGSGKSTAGAEMIVDLVADHRQVGVTANSHKVIDNLLEKVGEAARARGVTVRAMHKVDDDEGFGDRFAECVDDNARVAEALAGREVDVVGGTAWLWAREEMTGLIDTLFVDEAGQMSLANVVAVSGAARNLVLLGDPQQLDQPVQGAHPVGAERSALAHFLGEARTVEAERGIFFEKTHRLHPAICEFTSELFYEGRLEPDDDLVRQTVLAEGLPASFEWLAGSGLRWVPVEHEVRTNESVEEADRVCEIWNALAGRQWIDRSGARRVIGPDDIVIVSPFNAHRLLIAERLPTAQVGTVDKFQGQQAAVSIYTMATSRPEDAPRGMAFLYSLNRLNVATSRAKALAIVVASPALLGAVPRSPDQLRMVNGLCAFVDAGKPSFST